MCREAQQNKFGHSGLIGCFHFKFSLSSSGILKAENICSLIGLLASTYRNHSTMSFKL
jgi:hypothetical protein